MGRVGRYVRLKAHEGQREVLVEHMLGVAQFLVDIPGCELYVINTSAADTDTVWVTEVWSSEAEPDASLTLDSVRALVEQVVPLPAEPPEREVLDWPGLNKETGKGSWSQGRFWVPPATVCRFGRRHITPNT